MLRRTWALIAIDLLAVGAGVLIATPFFMVLSAPFLIGN